MLSRSLLGAFFVAAGLLHFVKTDAYASIVPDLLPLEREIVYASGVAEIAGGLGVLAPGTRRLAGWWLIAALVAVFPANVNMATNRRTLPRHPRAAAVAPPGHPGRVHRLGMESGPPPSLRVDVPNYVR